MTATNTERRDRRRQISTTVHSAQGGRRVAIGTLIAATAITAGNFVAAATIWDRFPPGPGPWPAWVALLTLLLAVAVTTVRLDGQIPDWLFVLALVGGGTVAWLDIQATQGLLDRVVFPTAAPAVGALLMLAVAQRHVLTPLVCAAALSAVLAAAALAQLPEAGMFTLYGLTGSAITVFPVVLTAIAVHGFRDMVHRELELSRVKSTVETGSAPVGMAASAELAKLDLDAETLLERVANGYPITADVSRRAAELATGLRRRLIDGRTDTWLKHAVEESPYLSPHVLVTDQLGLAGKLDQKRRDGLLVALWMLASHVGPTAAGTAETSVSFEESDEGSPMIAVTVSRLQVRDIDPTVWEALGRVGDTAVDVDAAGFTVLITEPTHTMFRPTLIDNPARRGRHRDRPGRRDLPQKLAS